jgi:hydroxymethylbilane synthase
VRTLVIGSRASPLALRQAGWVKERIEAGGRPARVEVIHTSGDRIPDRPLASLGGKGVFVKEIEEALLAGSIDLAVHSLKDLPTAQPVGLRLACVPEREDPHDVLIAPGAPSLEGLRRGAIVGTGSPRRACQIHAVRPDVAIKDLRGNIDTRLGKLRQGGYDAILLALAGLRRLGSEVEAQVLDYDVMLPAVGQGALAVETRSDDPDSAAALAGLHDPATACAVEAERAFLRGLGGGCQAPIAAVAEVSGDRLLLRGLVGDPEGRRVVRHSLEGRAADPEAAGAALAEALLAQGAADLVQRFSTAPGPEGA